MQDPDQPLPVTSDSSLSRDIICGPLPFTGPPAILETDAAPPTLLADLEVLPPLLPNFLRDTHDPELSKAECERRLAECEALVEDYEREAQVRIGELLRAVRTQRLYRYLPGCATIEDYVARHWGRGRHWARQMILLVEVREAITMVTSVTMMAGERLTLPTRASQVRAFGALEHACWPKAWTLALAMSRPDRSPGVKEGKTAVARLQGQANAAPRPRRGMVAFTLADGTTKEMAPPKGGTVTVDLLRDKLRGMVRRNHDNRHSTRRWGREKMAEAQRVFLVMASAADQELSGGLTRENMPLVKDSCAALMGLRHT